jgi:hypothetical protein
MLCGSEVYSQSSSSYVVNIDIVGAPLNLDPNALAASISQNAALDGINSNSSFATFVSTDADISISGITTCNQGYYCPGDVAPIACQAGTYNDLYGKTSSSACINCSISYPGFYCGIGTITPGGCPSGSYLQSSQCITCPPGSYCVGQMNAPQACADGTYLGGGSLSSCLPCTPGNYCQKQSSTVGAIAVQQCPAGSFMPEYSTRSANECGVCPKGSYCPAGSIAGIQCPAGTANGLPSQSSNTSCVACGYGGYAIAGSIACTASCPAGSYCNINDKVPKACPVGQYNPNPGASACLACGAGLYCAGGGTSDGVPCADGTYLLNNVCTACPAGKFCLGNGVISPGPLPCAAGSYNSQSGKNWVTTFLVYILFYFLLTFGFF